MKLGAPGKFGKAEMAGLTNRFTHHHKFVSALAIFSLHGFSFLIINLLHFNFFVVSVILYACLLDAFLAFSLVLALIIALRLPARLGLNWFEMQLTMLVGLLCIIIYSILGPTVIDRSLSLYIVQKIDQRGGHVAEGALEDIFTKEYLPEFRLMDVRVTEQITSGTVERQGNCLVLTSRGEQLSSFVALYRSVFLPKKRNLRGEISGALIDPFTQSTELVDTTCNRLLSAGWQKGSTEGAQDTD